MREGFDTNNNGITENNREADRRDLVSRIIGQYVQGPVSDEAEGKFVAWLASEVHLEEKNEALLAVWNGIDRSFDHTTLDALAMVKARINNTSIEHKNKNRAKLRPGVLVGRVAAVLIPIMAVVGVYLWSHRNPVPAETVQPQAIAELTVVVPAGEDSLLILPDDSEVTIKGGSEFVYPEIFEETREVFLSGEAFFNVREGETPFLVKTDQLTVKVVGTEFNVSAYPDQEDIGVTLYSGIVETVVGEDIYRMETPGENLTYNKATAGIFRKMPELPKKTVTRTPRPALIEDEDADWNVPSRVLNIRYENLDKIFGALERHYGVRIISDNPSYDQGLYSVVFDDQDTIEDAMLVLQSLTGRFDFYMYGGVVYVQVR